MGQRKSPVNVKYVRIAVISLALVAGLVLLYVSDYSGTGVLVNRKSGREPPEVEWNRTYGGPRYGEAHSVVQTRDGGYALAGGNFLLVKTDSRGELEWNRTYFGPFLGTAWSVIQTRDGGYVLAGEVSDDFCLVKTGPRGELEWNRSYGGPGWGSARSAVQTEDGGYALAGTYETHGSLEVFWLVKTDSGGKKEWDGIYDTPEQEIGYSVVQTRDGGYALAGRSTEFPYGRDDFWLVKTDSGGREEWNRSYGGSDHETAYWTHLFLRFRGFRLLASEN